jgi:hypothetical protein
MKKSTERFIAADGWNEIVSGPCDLTSLLAELAHFGLSREDLAKVRVYKVVGTYTVEPPPVTLRLVPERTKKGR